MPLKQFMGVIVFIGFLFVLGCSREAAAPPERQGDTLHPGSMTPLPLGAIRPQGWLLDQLKLQANSLSGSLDEFWPDIKDSAWFGGKAEGWERAPYWLDGVVPLAFLLDDSRLKDKVTGYIETIITGQDDSGWIAPGENKGQFDLWAVFLILKPLIQYYEAVGDDRVPEVVEKCLRWVDEHIDRYPLFNWGKFRWFESLIGLYWLYERIEAKWLLDLAVKLQAQGFDWTEFFERWPLTRPTQKGKWTFMGHVVNNAMALKAPALWWRLTGQDRDRQMANRMMEAQDRYHGQVNALFSGDECLAGLDPSQGTELCAVMEYMYSLETLMAILGDPAHGDRLEKIAYNALPATFSPDMWAHQYDQQVNQVECSIREDRNWTTNGPESNIFGLEPNYGCCTSNLSQGWPKLVTHLWMQTPDPGLAAVVYGPCRVTHRIAGIPVQVDVTTDYPFREKITLRISTDQPVRFPLRLRIPSWADGATIGIEGEKEHFPEPGTFYNIDREWREESTITLVFPMKPGIIRSVNNAVAIQRGPLLFSLKLAEEWKKVNGDKPYRELPHSDWEVFSASPWNYALDLTEETLGTDLVFLEHPMGKRPFSPEGAPVSATVRGELIEDWKLVKGSAGPLPESPVTEGRSGRKENLVLIPYGCTNVRVTVFPLLKRK